MKQRKYAYRSISINISSDCNLNCNWCYKQADRNKELKYEDFYVMIIEKNIDKVVLIGGEPTIHSNFISILNLLQNKYVYLVTNGLEFSNQNFLNQCMKTRKKTEGYSTDLQSISLSLKGFDRKSFFSVTKTDKFECLCQAINNLNSYNILVTYNYTLSNSMKIEEMEMFSSFLKKNKIYNIIISDVRPYINNNKAIEHFNIIKDLEKLIYYLDTIGITTYFRPNNPLCQYDKRLIDYMISNKRLIINCAVKNIMSTFFK